MLGFVFVILSRERTWSISSEFLGWGRFCLLSSNQATKGKDKTISDNVKMS